MLNKADVPEALELAEFLKEDLEEKFGWPVFIVSAVAHQGLEPLKYQLLEIVKKDRRRRPKVAVDTEHTIIRPQAVDARRKGEPEFTVEEDPEFEGAFIVRGAKIERWINQTDFENDEAIGYLADRLNKIGVEDALRKVGAREGAQVTIGDISFEWEPLTGSGVDPTVAGRGQDARLMSTRAHLGGGAQACLPGLVFHRRVRLRRRRGGLPRALGGLGNRGNRVARQNVPRSPLSARRGGLRGLLCRLPTPAGRSGPGQFGRLVDHDYATFWTAPVPVPES